MLILSHRLRAYAYACVPRHINARWDQWTLYEINKIHSVVVLCSQKAPYSVTMKFVAAASAFCVLSASAFAPQRVSRAAVSIENHYCYEGEAPHLFVLLSTTSDVMKVCD